MYPVYGLAEASLAVSFPPPGAPLRTIALNRHRMGVGRPGRARRRRRTAMRSSSCPRAGPSPTASVRIADDDDRALPDGRIGHIQIRGDNVTRGYFENPEANAAAFTADGWLRTGDLGLMHDGELYISGRAKEIIFVNGQNYYPHDLEAIAQRADGPGARQGGRRRRAAARRARPSSWWCSCCIAAAWRSSCRSPRRWRASSTSRPGSRSREVVPVKRIPKTTSGKIQRHLLEESYVDGEFDAELAELAALRAAQRGPRDRRRAPRSRRSCKNICDAALEGKRVDVHDNLFEIGASSLKLIEIHEQIDREYPGLGGPHRAVRLPDHRRAGPAPGEQARRRGAGLRISRSRGAWIGRWPARSW